MERFFYHIYKFIQANKVLALSTIIVFLVGLIVVSSKLKFEEDITKLIPANKKAIVLNKVLDQVDFSDKIIVHLKAEPNEGNVDLTEIAENLKAELGETCQAYISEIQGVVSDSDLEETLDFVYKNLPLFLTTEDYKKIEHKVSPSEVAKKTAENFKSLISPSGFVTRNSILKDPFGITFLGLEKLKSLQVGEDFTIENGFVVTKDKKDLLLFIKPKLEPNETDKNTKFVAQLNAIKSSINNKFHKKASLNYYGATLIAVANANQIKQDIQLTVTIAISILLVILIIFYRRLSIPIILFIPTLFGALLAISTLFIFRGTISAISIGIGSVLLGITLDFSLHILTHYRSNLNVKELYNDVTRPIIMSSITTAMAFLCLLFIKSRALQDLGVFAAVSVLGSSFFALIVIPHLYKEKKNKVSKTNFIDNIARYSFSKSKALISLCVVLSLIAAFTYSKVLFDKDISKMNYQTEDLLLEEKALDNLLNTTSKSLYLVGYSNSIDKALQENDTIYNLLKKLKKTNKIISFSSSASVVLGKEKQHGKIKQWQKFWSKNKKDSVRFLLMKEGEIFGFKPSTFQAFYNKVNTKNDFVSLDEYSKVHAFNVKEFISGSDDFYTVLSSLKVTKENANEIKKLFSENKNVVVIDRQAMNETFLSTFKDNFNSLLGYSFFAVILVLFVFFRRLELVVITIIPIVLTWVVTLGVMGVFGISFNIFNIIISTFIFGLGVDYAIFMTNGLIKEYETGNLHLSIYRTSIILSVITTILGVGVLIFAKHPALYSIALVSLIGILTALLMTFVIQPIIFRGLITNRAKNGLAPLEFRKTFHSIISFTFYGVGGMLLSLFAITILKVLPINKKVKFRWLHKAMAKLATSVLYSNPFVNKKVHLNNVSLEKQAIIIANHTSFLDTLAIALVTPKVIFLVNDWVYKSPIFGQLAKVTGYYPVSSGVDGSLEHLKEKIKQGYSLVVFPEGKRMFSNKIGRFHKGAFLLAQELNLDILPLYIHGNSEVLPKGDFIIYDGAISVKLGDRVNMNDAELTGAIKEKTKTISAKFKKEFQSFREVMESDTYFKKLVLSNFTYKSSSIISAVKLDLKHNIETYARVSKHVALDAKLLHVSNDYGQLDLLLNYYSNSRKMYAYISDESKRNVAKNNFIGKDRSITYLNMLQLPSKVDTLIVSTKMTITELDLENISTVVVLNNSLEINVILKQNYTVSFQDSEIIILSNNK